MKTFKPSHPLWNTRGEPHKIVTVIQLDPTTIDWPLLRKQKIALLCAIDDSSNPQRSELLTGLLNLIDDLQDEAAKTIGEKPVFGFTSDD